MRRLAADLDLVAGAADRRERRRDLVSGRLATPAPGAAALGDGSALLVLGADADWLRPRLDLVAAATGITAKGFSRMTDAEVAHRTGLPLDVAALARQRQFSEPFLCEGDEVSLRTLDAAARRVGARVTRGGRFFHLIGDTDKGAAVDVVRATCPPGARLLGLGDAPNDLPLLRAVDDAVIVPGATGTCTRTWWRRSRARATHRRRAVGWNAAVLEWLAATEPQR